MSLLSKKSQGTTIFTSKPGELEYSTLITLDGVLSETHSASASVTSHPVEGGENITDHVQREPRLLSMTLTHSATPLHEVGEPFRVEKAHAIFTQALKLGYPLRVVSSLEDYGSLILTKYTVNRDRSTANELRASLEFKEVLLVDPFTVQIPASIVAQAQRASGKSKGKVGKQSTIEATPKEEEKAKKAVKQGPTVALAIYNLGKKVLVPTP